MQFGTGSRGVSSTTSFLQLLLRSTQPLRGSAQVSCRRLLPTHFFRCFSWPYLPTSHTAPPTSLIFLPNFRDSGPNGCDCDSWFSRSVSRSRQYWRTSTPGPFSGLTSDCALEWRVRALSECAAGARNIIAPGARGPRSCPAAQRRRPAAKSIALTEETLP